MNRKLLLFLTMAVTIGVLTGCGNKTESTTQESEIVEMDSATEEDSEVIDTESQETEEAEAVEIVDLKEYEDILPEDLGGNLAETLANALDPEHPVFEYNDEWMLYDVGNGAVKVGASANNDGYFVEVFGYVNNFTVYGLQVGMTEEEAEQILSEQGITANEDDYMKSYFITDNTYITLDVSGGIVDKITYACYLGTNKGVIVEE